MLVTLFGIETVVKEEQDQKAYSPIEVTLLGIETETNVSQS